MVWWLLEDNQSSNSCHQAYVVEAVTVPFDMVSSKEFEDVIKDSSLHSLQKGCQNEPVFESSSTGLDIKVEVMRDALVFFPSRGVA